MLVDSSVFIDFFNGRQTAQTDVLVAAIGQEVVLVADLVMVEVLQGFSDDREFERTRRVLESLDPIVVSDTATALLAAQYYRQLRRIGRTPRKTIDTLIATRCIVDGIPLLFSDRDFDPFVQHCGLVSAIDG